jgi:glyoxylase-like metal-dependent hydrolase (beta-lactamase superfamily II)
VGARGKKPHARDKASFVPELPGLLEATGRLEIVRGASATLGGAYTFTFSEGHTPGLMLTRVEGAVRGPVTFMADLVPGAAWVHVPITMGFDRYPELLVEEKEALLARAAKGKEWIFFTHDPDVAACTVIHDNGRFVLGERLARVEFA